MKLAAGRGLLLNKVIKAFSEFGSLTLADKTWDNVGVLIDCSDDFITKTYTQKQTVLLTVDINNKVIDEAISYRSNESIPVVILAYHPTIFKPIKKLTLDPSEEGYSHINELVIRCIRAGISVFSPHTALDNGPDGCRFAYDYFIY